jgi:oligoendopeptidase F
MAKNIVMTLMGLSLAAGSTGYSQERDRSKIAEKDKWNLSDIYPSEDAWRAQKEKVVAAIDSIDRFKGTLSRSAGDLLACLDATADLSKEFSRLYVYASMNSDTDTRDSKFMAMEQEMGQIGSTFAAKTSFMEPEILAMDKATVDGWIGQEKGLLVHKHYLGDILRRKAHTGSAGEEKVIADASLMADAPNTVFGIFSDADFPYADVTLSDDTTLRVDKPAFNFYRASANREDRKRVFAAYFTRLNEYRRTFGANLYAEVKKDMFYMKARNYGSSLESALDANNIPTAVYHSLVDGVNKNIGTFHRYLKLRKRILGLDTLHYYDLYAPLVEGIDLHYPIEESRKHILASLRPLGTEYTGVIAKALDERWIDLYPTEGKRSGAYSQGGAYDVHPYMLLNYNGKYDDMSTLTHELGHTMQSYFSNKHQPYATANYPIFVAEVASTFNEALLIEHMLKSITDPKARLSLLGNYLENIKGTVFRQTQFAEFELKIHEMAEHGEPLTGDRLNEVYAEITKRYYGHDQGICIVDDEIKSEWSHIPHMYYNFYMYQYATSYTASAALSEIVLAGDAGATKRYLDFLSAGGSDYPIELLRKAGVDMTTSTPLELTMKKMNHIMDEMERLLAGMKK